MSGSDTAPTTRRTRRKKILRIGGIILLLCALLYLATPWLIPGRWIAATLASRMQRLMNRPVQIESVVFDYRRGLTIKGFRIGRREGFGDGALAEAEELSIPLSRYALARPARLLGHLLGVSTAPFERIEIRQPQCWAVVNEKGALNIADLNDRGGARLPARLFEITGLTLNFIGLRPSAIESTHQRAWSGSDQQRIFLPTLKCRLTPSTGHVNVEGGPQATDADTGGRVAVSGDITTPRLRADAPLGGGGSIQWRDLDLRQVPRLLIPFEGVQALRGISDGSLEVQISEDLSITFTADVTVHRLTVLLNGGRSWPLFEQSSLSIAGRWDPQAEYIEFSKLKYDAPQAISLAGRGSIAVVIDPHSQRQVVVALSGRAESLDVLRKQLAVPLAVLRVAGMDDFRADGPCEFEFDYVRTNQNDRYDIRIDATQSRIVWDDRVNLPSGETKRVALTLNHLGTGQWHCKRCDVTLGRSNLEVTGNWPMDSSEQASGFGLQASGASLEARSPKPEAQSLEPAPGFGFLHRLRTSGLQLAFETADFAELFDRAPVLEQWLPHVDAKGPGSLRLELSAVSDQRSAIEGARFTGHLDLGADTALKIGRAIEKKPGMPLSVNYSGRWSAKSAGRLEDVHIDLHYGPARMVTTGEGADFTITADLPESEWDREKLLRGTLEVSTSTSAEFVAVEHFVSLFPGLDERLREVNATGAALAGDCRVGVSANLASIHGKLVARVHVNVEGDELAIRAGDVFELRRGDAARFELDYRYDARRPQASEMFGLIAELPGGRLEAVSEWQQANDRAGGSADENNGETIHDLSVELKYDDLPKFASHFPVVQRRLEPYNLGGAGRLNLEASERGDAHTWRVNADFTETDLAPTVDGWLKPAGAPLTLALDGRLERDAQGNAAARLLLDRLTCTLGASTFKTTEFAAELGNFSEPARLPSGSTTNPDAPPILRRLRCSAHVDAALEGPWRVQTFNAHLGDWLERYKTAGELTFDCNLDYDGARWTLMALAEATDLAFAAPPQIAKPAGLPAEFEVDASIVPARNATSPATLKLRLCELRIGEMSASANGTLVARSARKLLDEVEAADIVVTIDAPDLSQLAQVWPGLSGAELSGRLRLAAALAATNVGWSVDSAMLDLDEVRVSAGESELSASGVVQYDQGRWRSDSLELEAASWRALLTGDGCLTDSEKPLQFTVRFGEVDGDQATADLRAMISDAATLWSRATAHSITGTDLEEMLLGDSQFGALYADATLQFDALRWFDSDRRVMHDFDEVVSELACRQGDCDWEVRGGYEGGLAQVRVRGKPSDPELHIVLTEALSTERIQLLLRAAYPGLEPSGTVDYSRIPGAPPQRWSADEGPAVAYGEVIVRGGVLRGKAAKGWVTTIFPRLNLAAFNFELMHDWFTEYADGRIQHQAIFQGKYYNLYASGWENNGATVEYQIGIDLLGGLESVYWATSGSGRIPLFESVTRLGDDGEVLEETVNYVPLDFVKAIVWGANPIHTAYMALRKRVLEDRSD